MDLNLKHYLTYIINPHLIEKFITLFQFKKMISFFSLDKINLSFNVSSDIIYESPFSFYIHIMFLELISGQKLKLVQSRKQINDFNLKKKFKIGGMVTLTKDLMYLFLLKFILINQYELYNFKGFIIDSITKNKNITFGFKTLDCFDPIFTSYEQWAFLSDHLRYGLNIDIVNNYDNSFINEIILSHLGFWFYNDYIY